MTVFVGIVTYNSLADLPDCFASLRQQTTQETIQVLVQDNTSSDGSADWVARHAPEALLIRSIENVGYGQGHNALLKQIDLTEGDFYLALNPDVYLLPGYIDGLVHFARQSQVGHLVGKLLMTPSTGQNAEILYSAGHALDRTGYFFHVGSGQPEHNFAEPRPVFGASGAAVLLSALFIRTLAPEGELFDRDMFLYGEDTDLDWRAQRLGLPCWYVPTAQAYHRGSRPGADLQRQALGNRYLSIIKNAFLVDLIAWHLPLITAHCLFRIFAHPRRGWKLAWQILQLSPRMLRKRRRPLVPRSTMLHWYAWADQQPTEQPKHLVDRLKCFFKARKQTNASAAPARLQ